MKRLRTSVLILILLVCPMILWAQEGAIQVHIKGLSCPFCVYGVEKKLKKVSGIESVTTSYKHSLVTLQKDKSTRIDITALNKAVTDAGFSVDSIVLTVTGTLSSWENHPALKDGTSGQLFLLVDGGKSHPDEMLSPEKLQELKSLSQGNKKALVIEGRAHVHVDMPTAIEVTKYSQASGLPRRKASSK